MLKPASSLSRTATLAALLAGSMAMAACSSDYAQNGAPQTTTQTQASMAQEAQPAPAPQHNWRGKKEVENRIKTLHDKLQVTPAEESAWENVASTMRSNEAALSELVYERHTNASTMTAVDDLQSYQRITQTRADGMQKMVDAFSSLYDEMSPAQKKNADNVFGRFEGHRGAGHHHHHHHSTKKQAPAAKK